MTAVPLRVAILGAGNVGREVVRAFADRPERLQPDGGARLELVGIAVRDVDAARRRGLPPELLTDAPAHLVADPDTDVIVELMGGDEPARTLIAAALAAGKAVVTANKHVIAHHGPELEAAARRAGTALRFEAAVGGGIPVLGPLAELAANRVTAVRGIVNGTTNYILSAMTDEGCGYDEALAAAQAAGYAEADPAGDVEGHDAVNKLVILARLAFGSWLDPADVTSTGGSDGPGGGRPGISGVTSRDDGRRARGRDGDQADRLRRAGGGGDRGVRRRDPSRAGHRSGPYLRRHQPDRDRRGAARDRRILGSGCRWRRNVECRPRRPSRDCPRCGQHVGGAAVRGPARAARSMTRSPTPTTSRPSLVARYRSYLPITDATPELTLGEGFTPLVRLERIGERIGLSNLHAKVEGQNPTGSFKDRGMVVAVAKALEEGARAIICASTGNTSASAAAYGAHAGLEVVVVLPRGKIAMGKLLQAIVAGARVVAVDGNFDAAFGIVRALAEQDDHPVTLVNSVNPFRLEGQKTAAFEVCDDLGRAPAILAIPVGNAGNISAYWAGFREYAADGVVETRPRMFGFQASGAAPLVLGRPVDEPDTIATAIRIGNPASWSKAIAARDESGGLIESVSDDEILAAYRSLARDEGIFCEPSSATSVAGVIKVAARGDIPRDALVVCVLTGTGLKDPATAEAMAAGAVLEAEPTVGSVAVALGW